MDILKFKKGKIFKVIVILTFILTLFIMSRFDMRFQAYGITDKLDMKFGYSSDDIYSLFKLLGLENKGIYIGYLCVDFIFIASFVLLQNYISKLVMGVLSKRKWSILLYLPYLRGLFDVIENILFIVLFLSVPKEISWLVAISSFFTQVKFITLGVWFLSLFASFLARIILISKSEKRGS